MSPAPKCRRTCAPELPVCLLLEIAARSDAATIFRCAATCRLLRREILSADFVRRVCQGPDAVMPSRILCVLADTFSVVDPITAVTAAIGRRFAQAAAGLLERFEPVKSRDGLVVLCRRSLGSQRRSADLCVYDPMSNRRAFLPFAPDIDRGQFGGGVHLIDRCTLLTAADGIGCCSFMLVAADMVRNTGSASSSARVRVQTVSSGGAGWGPVKTIDRHRCPRWCTNRDTHTDAAVVVGGVVHWLMHCGMSSSPSLQEGVVGEHILTYDVNAAAVGSVDLPTDRRRPDLRNEPALPSRLTSSPDGKLSFAVLDHCEVFLWVLSGGGSWAPRVRIDKAAQQGPMLKPWIWMDRRFELESFVGDRSSGKVFLRFGGARFVLNEGTRATCRTCLGGETGVPYEVDLASWLASMKSL